MEALTWPPSRTTRALPMTKGPPMLRVEPVVMVNEQPVRLRLPMETTPESVIPDARIVAGQSMTTSSAGISASMS